MGCTKQHQAHDKFKSIFSNSWLNRKDFFAFVGPEDLSTIYWRLTNKNYIFWSLALGGDNIQYFATLLSV